MIKESLIIRSTISSSLLKKTLFQGFSLALLGSVILVLAGALLSLSVLKIWGGMIFFVGLGLITWGLLPYRRLAYLQMHPHQLILMNTDQVMVYINSKKILTLSLSSISKMHYRNQSKNYGILIWLKTIPSSLIMGHSASKELQQLQKINKADLFLPYFNQQAYHELREWQEAANAEIF